MKDADADKLIFCSRAGNDLYRTVVAAGIGCSRYDQACQAVAAAPAGAGILILADGYPRETTPLRPGIFETAARKKLRLYVEFPAFLPDLTVGPVQATDLERVVVASEIFGEALSPMRILTVHDCHFVPVTGSSRAHLVVAKIAGFDRAVYGLDGAAVHPILFEHESGLLLVSTTKLSQFITARYAPKVAFGAIWKMVLQWLAPGRTLPNLDWMPTVYPTYEREQSLPANAARQAIQRGIDWHFQAKMLLNEDSAAEFRRRCAQDPVPALAPLPRTQEPAGDGRLGILEGLSSRVNYDGTQLARWWVRSDCNGESSLAFALRWKLDGDPRSKAAAGNLLDWTYFHSGLFVDDPSQEEYGLLRWGAHNLKSLYQDNDIKVILAGLGTAGVLRTDRWNDALVKTILGNFRTTGVHGFRGSQINGPELAAAGWRRYWQDEKRFLQPHYEAWMWAAYLWLYGKTRYEPLLTRTRHAIRLMMEAYPDCWRWTNGLQQERARMLLPLAWLVRVDDRPEHRAWLTRLAEDLERAQDACGAIREELGDLKQGQYRPPSSNAAYGTAEAPLIQANGDALADLLYTCNFAFLGLHEAHSATGDRRYGRLADRLADFLIRIQACSPTHRELDGAWFRAFDYRQWEYWGSNADLDWGAWTVEVGWTQGWIPTVLALRELKLSLWELSVAGQIQDSFERIRPQMLPDGTPLYPEIWK